MNISFRTGMCAAAGVIGKAPPRESRLNITNDRTIVGQRANTIIAIIVNDNVAFNRHVLPNRQISDHKESIRVATIILYSP